jgi:hypothetical protein
MISNVPLTTGTRLGVAKGPQRADPERDDRVDALITFSPEHHSILKRSPQSADA